MKGICMVKLIDLCEERNRLQKAIARVQEKIDFMGQDCPGDVEFDPFAFKIFKTLEIMDDPTMDNKERARILSKLESENMA